MIVSSSKFSLHISSETGQLESRNDLADAEKYPRNNNPEISLYLPFIKVAVQRKPHN